MSILSYVLTPFFLFLALFLAKRLIKYFLKIYSFFRDHYVLWNVAFGGHSNRRNVNHHLRLHAYVCKTVLLDNISINELFVFGSQLLESEITVEQFQRVLLSYKFIIICRDKLDGSLRGMCLIDKGTKGTDRHRYTIIKLGLALFTNYYQGGPLLYYVVFYHILKEMLYHPHTPVYVMSKVFTYKSYLGLLKNFTNFYPRHDAPTPSFEKKLINEFANSIRGQHEDYDPETFVLKRELSNIKGHIAPITEEELKNPHIKFFAERNPDWSKGHCLFTIATVRKMDLIHILWKAIKRVLGKQSSKQIDFQRQKRKSFHRHLSYQCPDAQKVVFQHYQIDSSGTFMSLFGSSGDIYIAPAKDKESIMF